MFNSHALSFTEMEAARERVLVRVLAVARKKEEKEKGKEGVSLSAL